MSTTRNLSSEKRGGKRDGAGRKSLYEQQTKVMRVPVGMVNQIKSFITSNATGLALPLYSSKVSAGFPSPADDHIESRLDLNDHLIDHPSATFFVRVKGDSMLLAGIHDDDLLIVDRSLEVRDGRVVIAVIDGELTVKRLRIKNNTHWLMPENPDYEPIELKIENDIHVWGVVTNVIHTVK